MRSYRDFYDSYLFVQAMNMISDWLRVAQSNASIFAVTNFSAETWLCLSAFEEQVGTQTEKCTETLNIWWKTRHVCHQIPLNLSNFLAKIGDFGENSDPSRVYT